MKSDLSRVVESFGELTVLVIGEAMLDTYLQGTSDRVCREAPVPVVAVKERIDAAGGAGNTAVNVRSLGANVAFLSVVGDDEEGAVLRDVLRDRGVACAHIITERGRRTLTKRRVIADSHLLVRFDEGSVDPLSEQIERRFVQELRRLFRTCDAVVISDYSYGVLTPRVIDTLRDLQSETPKIIVADSKHLELLVDIGVTAVKPNFEEAVRLLRLPPASNGDRMEVLRQHGSKLLEITGAQIAALTLDRDGGIIFEREREPHQTYTTPTKNASAAGAGDTFVSALALALAAGVHTPGAGELAAAAAEVVVRKDGTSYCSGSELRDYFTSGEKSCDVDQIGEKVTSLRQQGRRIVFTNGCFDILHRGHITYLNRAKALGDILIVGVNSDESIRRLKGESRPINMLDDRVQVLAALSCIDHIVPFDEETPEKLIRAVRPDVFVKGGDYTRDTLPEAKIVESLGGEVKILAYLEDRSTSGIIDRIREVYGAKEGSTTPPEVRPDAGGEMGRGEEASVR